MANYSLVSNHSFQRRSFDDMVKPLMLYTEEYNKLEDAYDDISANADKFKYLSETLPEGSKARRIYEGYANDLKTQADDLARNGLSMGNRRALRNLKRRYAGEIGRLAVADEAMREQQKLRSAARANGQNILYATENLSLDDFLDNQTPNMYNINTEELRKEGAQYAQASTSRIYSDTRVEPLAKYYQELIQTMGYSPQLLMEFRRNMEAIPEFQRAVDDIMEAHGVHANLTGVNYDIARQNIINGILEGALYKESRNVQQNPGVLTAAQSAQNARSLESQQLTAAAAGMVKDSSSPTGYRYDIEHDPKLASSLWMYDIQDGQIKGYSQEYKDMVKKGQIPTQKGGIRTVNNNGNRGASTGRQEKYEPKPDVRYNTKTHSTSNIETGSGKELGVEIPLEQAIIEAPDLVNEVGMDYAKYYKFYKLNSTIARKYNGSNVKVSSSPNVQNTPTYQEPTDGYIYDEDDLEEGNPDDDY